MSSDRSSGSRTLRIQAKTLATFHINNPNAKEEYGQNGFDYDRYLRVVLGKRQMSFLGFQQLLKHPVAQLRHKHLVLHK